MANTVQLYAPAPGSGRWTATTLQLQLHGNPEKQRKGATLPAAFCRLLPLNGSATARKME